jgi:hypothetical protein
MLRRGFVLREEPFGRLYEVDAVTRDRLRAFTPKVALHRAGHISGPFETAAELGVLAETDVRAHRGELVVSHEHRLGPLSFDRSRLLLRCGDPGLPLTAVLEEAQRLRARMLLDLKLDATWAPALMGALKRYELLDSVTFTGEWEVLDAIAASSVEAPSLYYGSINRPWKLTRFLEQQTERGRRGISLNKRLASRDNLGRLQDAGLSVLVYVVSRPDEALALLERGADGLITNNVVLAEVWGSAEAALD